MSNGIVLKPKIRGHVLVVRDCDDKVRTQLANGKTVYITKDEYFEYKKTGALPNELEYHKDGS